MYFEKETSQTARKPSIPSEKVLGCKKKLRSKYPPQKTLRCGVTQGKSAVFVYVHDASPFTEKYRLALIPSKKYLIAH